MNETQTRNEEVGPLYSVPLLDVLPILGSQLQQALPSRDDLQEVLDKCDQGHRVVGGFEVLSGHYHTLRVEADFAPQWLPRPDRPGDWEWRLNGLRIPVEVVSLKPFKMTVPMNMRCPSLDHGSWYGPIPSPPEDTADGS